MKKLTFEEINDVIKNSKSMREASNKTADQYGIGYRAFKRIALFYNLWKPNQAGVKIFKRKWDEDLIFSKDSPCRSAAIKRILVQDNIKEYKCEWCGISNTWNGKPITLELDHINGNNRDNQLKNLRILCPNCHSQTPTFRRKKKCPSDEIGETC